MALRFNKRLSILPGVRLNFGRSGMSATLGVSGASITIGGVRGPSANLGLPGTGLSMRIPLNNESRSSSEGEAPSGLPSGFQSRSLPRDQLPSSELRAIQSDPVATLTSPSLIEFRNLLISAGRQREEADQALSDATEALVRCQHAVTDVRQRYEEQELRLARLEVSWLRRLRKGAIAVAKKKIEQSTRAMTENAGHLQQAQAQKDQAAARRDELWVETEFGLPSSAQAAWAKVADAFSALSRSERAWDITAARTKRAGAERSVATQVVERKPIQLASAELPILRSQYNALRWQNANGNDLFFYPGLLIVFQSEREFALLDLGEVELRFDPVRFNEQESPPIDAKQVGTAWTYANRDGSPDRRYSNNPQWPVLLYGEIHFKSKTGLSEAYMFSNAQAAAAFVNEVTEFRSGLLGRLKKERLDTPFGQLFATEAVCRRVDIRVLSYKVGPDSTCEFTFELKCRGCGSVDTTTSGVDTEGAIVSCKACGSEHGELADINIVKRRAAQEELRKRMGDQAPTLN